MKEYGAPPLNFLSEALRNTLILIDLPQTVLLFGLFTMVAPGRRPNDTLWSLNRLCSLGEFVSRAHCEPSRYRLVCRGGFSPYWIKGIKSDITHLQVLDWPGDCLNISRLQYHFPELVNLELINSTSLRSLKGHFNAESKIKNLKVHGMTSLWEIPPDIVTEMRELREMDLRGNKLRHIKSQLLNGPVHLERVYLGDNSWDCSDGGLDWLAMETDNGTARTRIMDYDQLLCHHQFYIGKPLNRVMEIIRTMLKTCPEPCACKLVHVVQKPSHGAHSHGERSAGAVIPIIRVDCSQKQLEEPPKSLPPGTTTLRLEGNKLNTIRSIVHNPQYNDLVDLYLDNNSISAVKELEGTEWFSTFRVLSLRGNMLKQIPVYAFDKAFQANNNIMHVYLGNNPWRCDCHYIPRFQFLLLKYKKIIQDLADIKCSKSSDKKTSMVQISTIPLGNVCGSDEAEMPISPINIVNLVLLGLIMLVVGKFLYDWHTFKETGKLPWLSSILP